MVVDFTYEILFITFVTLLCGQVILDLLNRIGALSDKRVKIVFIDTFHLFPETHQFLGELEVSLMGYSCDIAHHFSMLPGSNFCIPLCNPKLSMVSRMPQPYFCRTEMYGCW